MPVAAKPRANTTANRPLAEADVPLPGPTVQLGARIAQPAHWQLKLAAVLGGVPVQTLVERAIHEFLTNHPELVPAKPIQKTRRPREG